MIATRRRACPHEELGGESLICEDVAHLTVSDLPGSVDLAWASPPCVGASLAGKRKGLGPEAWVFLKLMQDLRGEGRAPRLIAIENVVAMLTSLGGTSTGSAMRSPTPTIATARW